MGTKGLAESALRASPKKGAWTRGDSITDKEQTPDIRALGTRVAGSLIPDGRDGTRMKAPILARQKPRKNGVGKSKGPRVQPLGNTLPLTGGGAREKGQTVRRVPDVKKR